jgi:putative solute:sodium symporter small subunit
MTQDMTDPNLLTYRRRSRALMRLTLGLWALFGLCLPVLVVPLNALSIPYLDLPVGFLMSTQGGLVAFVLVLCSFARRQDRIDRDHFRAVV